MKRTIVAMFQAARAWFGETLVRYRSVMVITVQAALIAAANMTAFVLRFDGGIPPLYLSLAYQALPLVMILFGIALWIFRIQQGLWRYVGLHDLGRILWACVASTVAMYLLLHGLFGWIHYPRSVIILTGLLGGLYLAGIRLAVRWFREWLNFLEPQDRRVLIVGAGNAGELLVRDMLSDPNYRSRPVALVDDDPIKHRMRIHGVPVVGPIADIKEATQRLRVAEVIVAIPSASTSLKQQILAASEGIAVPIKTLPSVKRLLDDPISMRQVRPMSLEDLLQREPVQSDPPHLRPLIAGKRVLVTGAGGSIGSELCRQIALYDPESLVLFERHENSLHMLEMELRETNPELKYLPVIGDVTMWEQVASTFKTVAPQLVFHAAAHKHVPMMERNPGEAIRNNVFGTRIVAEAARVLGAQRFVLISTDKAVNPTSVMGATKRIAEFLIQNLDQQSQTKFSAVRFGNVLGSSGSVVPLFAEQIRKGGPVTVTHPEIKRYFMTIPEAVHLVLQSSRLGEGGDVFVLEMGEQIRIADLARNMIVLSGLVPEKDIRLTFTGLRPGEKLYEELVESTESAESTAHPKIRRLVGEVSSRPRDVERMLSELETVVHGQDAPLIWLKLREIVPTYAQVRAETWTTVS